MQVHQVNDVQLAVVVDVEDAEGDPIVVLLVLVVAKQVQRLEEPVETDLVAIVAARQVQIEELTEVLGRRLVVFFRLEVEHPREVLQDISLSQINLRLGEWLSGGGVRRELLQVLPGM